eukprot:GFYU01005754.1.p1 GENE.GFYU01005754.1~~GFYU01005754.1.p1  ORF type:complete len:401 (+),score=85.31 GFYU01005754.1:163-1365(+)
MGDLAAYLSMPFTSGVVGWATNILAIKMTFYPLEFFGIWKPWIGWQGIIPAKAPIMASKAVDMMTAKLIDPKEIFSRLDPERIAQELEPGLMRMSESIMNEVGMEVAPTVWQALPTSIKQELYAKAREEAPVYIAQLMEDIKNNIEEVFDLKHMVLQNLVENPELLNYIFSKCGEKEFIFIERSGFYFGFPFGIIQACVWYFYKGLWILPAFGFVLGYLTNYLAMKAIFEPVKPVKIGPWTLQGLFLKRQAEVSVLFAEIVAAKTLTSRQVMGAIIEGPKSDNFFYLLSRQVMLFLDSYTGLSTPLIQFAIGTDEYTAIKHKVCAAIKRDLHLYVKYIYVYSDEALDVQNTIESKLKVLPAEEFEGLLHPIFQEDEWKLILVGGVLGLMVGIFQLLVVFA